MATDPRHHIFEDRPGSRCARPYSHSHTGVRRGGCSWIYRAPPILFGGAKALENNSSVPSSSSFCSAEIPLAGPSPDVHCYNVLSNKWSRLNPLGEPPSPRAAHASTTVGMLVVVQGGIGPAGLSDPDLHVLDLSQQTPQWNRVLVHGSGPGQRYGHVMALIGERFLLVIGGNDGQSHLADRVKAHLHSCMRLQVYSDGLLLLCGGRDCNGVPLSNVYVLARSNEGKWAWASSPILPPSPPRYHHAAHLSTGLWCDSDYAVANPLTWRCKHAAAAVGHRIFIYGGLSAGVVLDDLVIVEDSLDVVEKTKGAFGSPIKIPPNNNNSSHSGKALVRLHHRAVVAAAKSARKLLDCQLSTHNVSKKIIVQLLKPKGWKPPVRRRFFLDYNEIAELCDSAERIFSTQPSLLKLKAPIKIFGDIHGQFEDLMRFFDEYGAPSTAGDIKYIDYLFLGDYIDRGQHSLETISLLLALKVEYPNNVHLIRGSHETADINALFGFRKECIERMGREMGYGLGSG
ncbi:hypothetical protein LUZ60_005157 [Juncus effusus]|nr:hypothetical protein LUZ60_005157 [Juncus effusus]